jgi:glycosyltransferase involved in cell wall biosynthesis
VRDGCTGRLLPVEAEAEAYAEVIAEIVRDGEVYHRLAISSRDEYEKRLNWDVFGSRLREILERIVANTDVVRLSNR